MSSRSNRRRHTDSAAARYRPSHLVPAEPDRPGRIGSAELAACGAVAIVAFALIALIWIVTTRAVQEQQGEIRDRAEHALAGQAATIAETVGHELLMIDQSLAVLQSAWKADSESFDITAWQNTMPALMAVADDLFIADERHVIRQDIMPKAVGQGVGSAYVTFPHGSLEQLQSDGTKSKDFLVLQGDTGQPIEARQFLMYVVRPLDHPKGWLIGASYRSEELTKLFAEAALGYNSVVALTDINLGVVQSVVGPAARRPKIDISRSPLFAAMTRSPSGIWLGETAIDGVERIHAFHRVANRDMSVLVAANWSEVMAVANDLAAGTRAVGFVGSAVVLVIGGMVLWQLSTSRGNKRRKRVSERNRRELERLRAEESGVAARAELDAARLKVLIESTADGIALFDSSLRLVQWNRPFHWGIGIDLKQDMPLDSLLRAQAGHGQFGRGLDLEGEISRRAGMLRNGDPAGVPQPGRNDETLILRGLPIADGGFMLMLNGLKTWEPAAPASRKVDEPANPETVAATQVEW